MSTMKAYSTLDHRTRCGFPGRTETIHSNGVPMVFRRILTQRTTEIGTLQQVTSRIYHVAHVSLRAEGARHH